MKSIFRISVIIALLAMLLPFNTIQAQNKRKSFGDDNNTMVEEVQTKDSGRSYSSYSNSRFIPTMDLGYGFVDSDGYSYEVTLGVNYEFVRNLYIGARIGYLGGGYNYYSNDYGMNVAVDCSTHFIAIPIELGYTLVNDRYFGVTPFVGAGFNIGLSGKVEVNDYEEDLEMGGEIGIDARAGLRVMLGGFTISGTYHFPLNDNQEAFFGDDAYPEISIGWFMFD